MKQIRIFRTLITLLALRLVLVVASCIFGLLIVLDICEKQQVKRDLDLFVITCLIHYGIYNFYGFLKSKLG